MNMTASNGDIDFKNRFETGEVSPSEFHHRDHLRLVFVYLCESSTEASNDRMRTSLRKFLQENNVPPEKYHESVTYSWVQAVRHFMEKANRATSFDEFLAADERLLDTEIMLSHYRKETLFTDRARVEFVEPDIEAIPQYS